jgi:hypothetical protein
MTVTREQMEAAGVTFAEDGTIIDGRHRAEALEAAPEGITLMEAARIQGDMRAAAAEGGVKVTPPLLVTFEGAEYKQAPDLEHLAEDLLDRCPELGHIQDMGVVYLWKEEGGRSKGRPVFGKTQKASGLLAYYSGSPDFIIWLAADHCLNRGYGPDKIEALLYHEMSHISLEVDEKTGVTKPVLVGHDFEGFAAEIRRYGLWSTEAKMVGNAIRQLPLEGV